MGVFPGGPDLTPATGAPLPGMQGMTNDQLAYIRTWMEQQQPQVKKLVPFSRVRRTSDLTLTNATDTKIPWDTVEDDPLAMYDSGNQTRLTAPRAGSWEFSGFVRFSNGTGYRLIVPYINGATLGSGTEDLVASYSNAAAASPEILPFTFTWTLSEGDYFELAANHNNGSDLTCRQAQALMKFLG